MASQPLTRLHRLYYVLALFSVATAAASLYVGHEMIDAVRASVRLHRETQARLDRYSELGRLAQTANLPVNDAFADRAVELHSLEFREAEAALDAAIAAERQKAGTLPADEQAILGLHLEELASSLVAMEQDAGGVFQNLRADKLAEAASAMA